MDRRKSLLNIRERETFNALSKAVKEHKAEIFAKIRIADTVELERSGISDDLFSFALKAHFDFVVGRGQEATALFAVEFDGMQHLSNWRARENDKKKESLCQQLGLPLLRIDGAMLKEIGKRPIVGWLAHMWFMNEAWEQSEVDPFEEFDNLFWFNFNPVLETAMLEVIERGETIVNGFKITGKTSLDHPELRKLNRLEPALDMDPFNKARLYLSRQRDELGVRYGGAFFVL